MATTSELLTTVCKLPTKKAVQMSNLSKLISLSPPISSEVTKNASAMRETLR